MKLFALVAITAFAVLYSFPLHAQESERTQHLWLETDFYYRLSEKTRFLGVIEVDQDRNLGSRDVYAGAFVDFGIRPILRPYVTEQDFASTPLDFLRLRVGAAYLASINAEEPFHEVRGVVDLTPRYRLGGFLVTVRNRTEYRFLDNGFAFRYRGRLWIEHTFYDVGPVILTPFAASEIYYQSDLGGFFRLRSHVGVSVGVTSWFAPDIRYVYQRQWNDGGRDIEALYLTFAFYL